VAFRRRRATPSKRRPVSAGYSGTPLVAKLGIKPGMRVVAVGAPAKFSATLGELPTRASITTKLAPRAVLIVAFVKSLAKLELGFDRWKGALASDGALWICWPKRSSGVATDLSEGAIRTIGLARGLVDLKVCAVDGVWSGLRFVYRLKDRK